ncbi:hypothetical protein AB5V95_02850 [Metamycoplasma spumans]|uniref:hypothetical protein n=1 Tax=Metamycoplasma spumans TaxID=92406 RepID=UPI000687CB5A
MNNYFDNLLNSLKSENFDPEQEKQRVISYPQVAKLIEDLSLNDMQITWGMNYLQKYYDYLIQHDNQEPSWKLFVNNDGLLDIDFSNEDYLLRQKKLSNFWLTSVTPLDDSWYEYFNMIRIKKPDEILKNSHNGIMHFSEDIQKQIKNITGIKHNLGLYLVDENFINARHILKYIAFIMGVQKNKTVAFLDSLALYQFLISNFKNGSAEINGIQKNLIDVDYLFLDRFGLGSKPEWFINFLINVLTERELRNKPVFIASPLDFIKDNQTLIANSKNKENDGLNKLEQLLKNTIGRICVKFTAK